jgi:5-methylcytosine-specific restriction endonuclease McrA
MLRVCRGVPGEPCTALIPHGDYYCNGCKRQDNRRRALKAGKAGLKTRYWREVRLARLRLDGFRCALQVDEDCSGCAETVHLAPELKGNHLLATTENTRSACRRCHGVTDAPRSHH